MPYEEKKKYFYKNDKYQFAEEYLLEGIYKEIENR